MCAPVSPLRAGDTRLDKKPLSEVLKAFSERYQVLFSFDVELVRDVEVDFEFRAEEQLDIAINRLLNGTQLSYKNLGSKY
ncbi:MAG: hypothetical protein D6722_24865 [Bacteroidetes bacterium]|nr:MAG: hypothetical protein D6722_24865 [Bacteroidota bacterium]